MSRAPTPTRPRSPRPKGQTFCPYKGLASYYDITGTDGTAGAGTGAVARRAAWSYRDAYAEVGRISGLVSFEPDRAEVLIDGTRLRLEPGQSVVPHGIDRDLTLDEAPTGPSR
jgi:hypothetical protein